MASENDVVDVSADLKRQVKIVEPGLILIKQVIELESYEKGIDVTGPYWTLGFVKIKKGQIAYTSGNAKVNPPANYFAVFIPPYSIIEVELMTSHTENYGFTSLISLPSDMPKTPVIFVPKSDKIPDSVKQVVTSVRGGTGFLEISRAITPTGTSMRIKKFIETHYRSDFKIGEMAEKLKTSPAVVSRYFQKDFGLTPVQYRHWLRVMDSMVQIIEGSTVLDVANQTGFQSLSQFYEQFEKITHSAPAKYKSKKSKNRKK